MLQQESLRKKEADQRYCRIIFDYYAFILSIRRRGWAAGLCIPRLQLGDSYKNSECLRFRKKFLRKLLWVLRRRKLFTAQPRTDPFLMQAAYRCSLCSMFIFRNDSEMFRVLLIHLLKSIPSIRRNFFHPYSWSGEDVYPLSWDKKIPTLPVEGQAQKKRKGATNGAQGLLDSQRLSLIREVTLGFNCSVNVK